MIPSVPLQLALGDLRYKLLAQLDTGGVFTCLAPNCCSGYDTEEGDKAAKVEFLLQAYQVTGSLPTSLAEAMCCGTELYCGSELTAGTAGASGNFVDLTVTDDFILGGAPSIDSFRRGSGTLVAGALVISAPWLTATSRIVASYTVASAAGQANISVPTADRVDATSFTVRGEGTNTFEWIAIV